MNNAKFVKPIRNYENIQFGNVREVVEPVYTDLLDLLSDCYYNYWKFGNSQPFVVKQNAYDVQSSPEASKALFDKLHALLNHLMEIAIDTAFQEIPSTDPEKAKYIRYNQIRDAQDNFVGTRTAQTLQKIAALRAEGIRLEV